MRKTEIKPKYNTIEFMKLVNKNMKFINHSSNYTNVCLYIDIKR